MKRFLKSHPKLATVAFDLLAAFLLNFLIEILNHRSLIGAVSVLLTQPLLFLWATMLIFATIAFAGMFRHHYFALSFVSLLWIALGITNCALMVVRNSPFCGVDFYILSTGFSIALIYLQTWQIVLICVGIALLIAGLVFLYLKLPKTDGRPLSGILQTLVSIAIVIGLTVAVNFTPSIPKHLSEMKKSAEEYGFLYCFTKSIFDRGIDEPEEYGEEAVDSILTLLDDKREKTEGELPDVIFVQLESFFDINDLTELGLPYDPIPNFTRMKKDCVSGRLTVPGIGGGTANTEFEVITGMELDYFGTGEFPYDTVLKNKTTESYASVLGSLGYSTHAIHNHEGSFYDRDLVYPNLGFETFTSIEYMNGFDTTALGWCKDSALTDEILRCLDSTEGRDFVFTVSVQGHGRYPDEYRPEGGLTVESVVDPMERAQYEYYVEQIHEMDAFLAELTSALSRRGTPAAVVFYGDHLPALNITEDMLVPGRTLYQTDYVIWSNRPLRGEDEDLSTSLLGAKAMEAIGIHEGVFNALHQYYRTNEAHSEWMHLLQYDILFGDRRSFGTGDPHFNHKEMRMGIEPIAVDGAEVSEEGILIYGSGFTASSVVRAGGWSIPTEFVSPSCLLVHPTALHGGEKITVAQISGSLSILSETEEYVLPDPLPVKEDRP